MDTLEEVQVINEFELAVNIRKSGLIEVNCSLSDLRFIFAVPTA